MSTDHQRYSTENQSDAIRQYAKQRNIEIVQTYSDSGKSGLRIDGRDGLQHLIADIQSGEVNFECLSPLKLCQRRLSFGGGIYGAETVFG